MIRKLVIVFAILVVLVTPIPAHGGGGHGGHGHHRNHHHGHQFIGVIYAPFPFGAPCWEEGHWVDLHLRAPRGAAALGLLVLRGL
jgi:hypothetical protein